MNDKTEIKTLAGSKTWGRGRVFDNIAETIGQTPLVRLSKIMAATGAKADILMKLEFFNPLSSVKDRIGVSMIDRLEADGKITPGKTTLIEPTSGNTGIALAFVAAARGYRLILVMPETMSMERRKLLTHLGAELELTPGSGGMPAALDRAAQLAQTIPDAVIPAQFDNPANPLVHEKTTAEELWNDTQGKIDALVVGVGTGGTLTGCSRVLKPRIPGLRVFAVEPTASPVLSGGSRGPHKIQGIGAGFVPSILDTKLIDEVIQVTDDEAFEAARQLARIEGVPGGISTGGNLAAAIKVARRDDMAGKTVVTLAPSSADRYVSTALFVEPQAKTSG